MNDEAAQTILNSLAFAECKLPDGTIVFRPIQKAITKEGVVIWEFVDEKLGDFDRAAQEYDQRVKDSGTTTIPNNLDPVTTDVLTKNVPTSIRQMSPTRMHLSEELIMALGDPDRIIAQKGLDPEKLAVLQRDKLASSLLHARCILVGGKWAQIIQYVPNYHPTRR